jgi:hypothetical protein
MHKFQGLKKLHRALVLSPFPSPLPSLPSSSPPSSQGIPGVTPEIFQHFKCSQVSVFPIFSTKARHEPSSLLSDCTPTAYGLEVIGLSLVVEALIVTSCVTRRNTKVNADGQVVRVWTALVRRTYALVHPDTKKKRFLGPDEFNVEIILNEIQNTASFRDLHESVSKLIVKNPVSTFCIKSVTCMLVMALYGVLDIRYRAEGSSDNTAWLVRRSPSLTHRLSCRDLRFRSSRRFDLIATVDSDSAVHIVVSHRHLFAHEGCN